MVVSSLADLTDAQKQELVASLSAIVVGTSGADVTADSLTTVATASGNSLSGAWASVFAQVVGKSGGIEKFCLAPGGGGGGGEGGGGGGGEAAAEEAVEEVEEEEADMGGGMDMFGGGDGGDY
mmetsp:Transcript_9641/g.18996  ORF Transcript_9641/g.18996 Transcript_9641/m.18996 type:complete len:123 (+) Transcript_9641:245-613(+)|eukprot:CAMPEP_0171362846 /NCGR_PEP_ID=MMETSP0879-20121228/2950_1 /TAXON_ID=67004 /ORGANISM="Thalassiosira weissflogii, Strain CCMP1336" /LENGTH=122 /DNA_ID=CAMNT_0011869861 /DNA_START=239 /DNA_END=607 /DNA_ORIENTATION=+